jgi:predicted DNA-binding protein
MASQTKRKRGRPPSGNQGEKVSNYPQMTIRLPLETRAKLNTLSLLLATPMWRVVDQAIDAYVSRLPVEDQKILGPLVERLSRGDWPVTSHWDATLAKPRRRVRTESSIRRGL